MQFNEQEQHQEPQPVLYQTLDAAPIRSLPDSTHAADVGAYVKSVTPLAADTANALPEAVTARIEDYLDHVCAPLVGEVPFAARREWRSEMQTHLEALTRAYIELEAAPEAAVENALAQFGRPGKITRHLRREWLRTAPSEAPQSLLSATTTATGVFSAALLITGWADMYPPIQAVWCIALITMLGALSAGITTAALVRAHALAAAHNAAWLLGISFFVFLTRWQGLKTALPVAVVALVCGLTLGCLGACLETRNHWLRRKIRKRKMLRA